MPLHRATALCCCHYASLHSGFVWLTASILAWTRGGSPTLSPARTPGVYAQRLCTMQSQLSIHSPSPRGRGFRQGCRNKDTPSFKHGCLQVVEQSRCRTHRQQTTTIEQMQSQQSIHSLSPGKGAFGKDAEIRTHRALQEAKPSECRKGDRDSKSEVCFKNRLFLQADIILP